MLNNIRISVKMLIMVLVPIAGMLIFAARDISGKAASLHSLQTTRILTAFAIKSGALIHELQKERGLSAGFLSTKGEKFREELAKQRSDTDSQLKELKDYSAANQGNLERVKERLSAADTMLQQLAAIRGDVDSMRLEPQGALTAYTQTISSSLDVVAQITILSMNPDITREAMAYHAFLMVKEQTALERGTLNGVFASSRFDETTYERYVGIRAAQETFLDVFAKFTDAEHLKTFQKKMKAPFSLQVGEMRSIALAKRLTGDFGILPENWFATITAMINAMKEVEDLLAAHMGERANTLADTARLNLALNTFTAAGAAAASLLFGFIIMTGIATPLKTMARLLKDLTEGKGDLNRRLEGERADEIGEVGRWFNRFMDKIQAITTGGNSGG